MSRYASVALLTLLFGGTAAGQSIDLSAYVRDGPVGEWRAEAGLLYYQVRVGEGIFWRSIPVDSLLQHPGSLGRGTELYPGADVSQRTLVQPRATGAGSPTITIGDSAHDERWALYQVRAGSGVARRLTRTGSVQFVSAAAGRVAYRVEAGSREPYPSCLHLLELATGRDRTLACDNPPERYTGAPLISPGGRVVTQPVQGQPSYLLLVHLEDSDRVDTTRTGDGALPRFWRDDRRLVLARLDRDVANLHELDVRTGAERALTRNDSVAGMIMTGSPLLLGGRDVLLLRGEREIAALEAATGRVLGRHALADGESPIGHAGGSLWLIESHAVDRPPSVDLLQVLGSGDSVRFARHAVFRPDTTSLRVASACRVEKVSYTTFDGREISGWLRVPRQGAASLGIVYAYYGGDASYDALESLWCEAGVASLSPAVRGLGALAGMTNGDRGGDEIVDVIHGARWLARRLNLEPRRIGVFGMSQGGYNAMQTLTFDPATNGRNEPPFEFGFGIAQAGYSSMLTILHHTNTESPEIIATGDPATPAGQAALRARSPVDNIHRLEAPLLLIHGSNDQRVRIEESRQMLEAGRRAGKDVRLVELPAEGHGVKVTGNLLSFYRAQLEFLAEMRAR